MVPVCFPPLSVLPIDVPIMNSWLCGLWLSDEVLVGVGELLRDGLEASRWVDTSHDNPLVTVFTCVVFIGCDEATPVWLVIGYSGGFDCAFVHRSHAVHSRTH